MPTDIRDDCALSERQEHRIEKRSNYKESNNIESKPMRKFPQTVISLLNMHCVHDIEGGVVDEDPSSMLVCKEKEKKSLNKERQSQGIKAAVTIIVEIAMRDKKITEEQIDTVLASMLCVEIVTAKSPKGKKALKKATQIDKNFVRTAIDTCKKTKEMGGERGEMVYAAASVLACRNIRKYKKCKLNETTMGKISDLISRETMEIAKEEDYSNNNSKNNNSLSNVANDLATETYVDKNSIYIAREAMITVEREEKDFDKSDNEKTHEINYEENHEKNVAKTVDFCFFEDPSDVSLVHSIKSISSLDSGLRETIVKAWDENFIDYMTYGFAEVTNICGKQLICYSEEVRNDIRENMEIFRS